MNYSNLLAKIKENWVALVAAFLAVAAIVVLILMMWAHRVLVAEQQRWDVYSAAHRCTAAGYSVPYRSYECDDGFTYDRLEIK